MLSGLAASIIWGAMYVVSKIVLDAIPPFTLITTRLLLGGLALFIISRLQARPKLSAAGLLRIFAVGALGYGISLGFQFVGTKMSTAANGALVTSATPAFILLFAYVFLREPMGASRLLALLVSTIGVLAVLDPRTLALDASLFWGNLALFAAAATWAMYSVLIRLVTRDVDVLTVSLVAFLGGLPIAIPAGLIELSTGGVGNVTLGTVADVLFLGIVCTALAMFLWNNAFAILQASRASLTFFAQPIVGTFLGWVILGEQISPLFLAGGVLIALGIYLSSR
jgi:drug/metabolite transporter (DMT)-like permease